MKRLAVVCAASIALLTAAAQAYGRSDLVESHLGNPPARLAAGRAFTVTDVASNRGPTGAGRSLTRYYLRTGKTSLLAGARRVPALRRHARSRGRVRLSVRRGTQGGRYWIVACVDATRRIREGNERNNCRISRRRLAVPGPHGAASSSPPTATSADGDHDGYADSVDCAPNKASIHPGAIDKPDLEFVDSNCDGIDGDSARAVFVSPSGNDVAPGSMTAPLRTLAAAVTAGGERGKDVYAAAGTYPEELRLASRVSVYGGYGASWRRSLSGSTRITGATTASSDTEGALALNIAAPTTLQLVTLKPSAPTVAGASSYGLRGVGSAGLRIEHVTVLAAPGASGGVGAGGVPGASGGDGSSGDVGGPGGASLVAHPGGHGGYYGGFGAAGLDGEPGQATIPDPWLRRGGFGGVGGDGGSDHTSGAAGVAGDFGKFLGDGHGGGPGNANAGSGLWYGRSGQAGSRGSDGHGGGGGGGGGSDDCLSCSDRGGDGGGGGGGGQGGGGGRGGYPGGGSFGIFLTNSDDAVVRDSTVTASNGGTGGAGGGGALGGAGGAGGPGGGASGNDGSPGGAGGAGGPGARGGNGGGGAGGPSAAIVGLTADATPGTTVHHGAGGIGGGGDVSAAPGAAADYLVDGP